MIRGFIIVFLFAGSLAAQEPAHCVDPAFNSKVKDYVKGTVDLIDVDQLASEADRYIILDAREEEEYQVSHMKGALRIGYDNPDFNILKNIPADSEIVVYCSIGYRSEKIGERLLERGYKNVHNLYGGIFEWSNRAYPLVDREGEPTRALHTYSRLWSKWADPSKADRTW